MKRVTTGMGLVTVVVMAVLGMFSAGSASAQTLYLFLFTGPLPALVLILSDNNQVFKVESGSELTITCRHFIGRGSFSNGSAMWGSTGKINGTYGACEVPGGSKANVSEAEYEINAQGSVSVQNTIDITVPLTKCLILVGPTNAHLLTLLFLKDPLAPTLAILAHVNVSGIHSIIHSPTACGTLSSLSTTGTYKGLLLIWVDGGTIQWDS